MTHRVLKSCNSDATSLVKALGERLERLEVRVSALEVPWEVRQHSLPAEFYEPLSTPRGPKPKFPAYGERLRDDLIDMLESHWPELLVALRKPSKPENIRTVLKALLHPLQGTHRASAKHLLDNFDVLLRFLKSNRFRNDPRQLANAMAGVPHVSFWRSLKVCGSMPSMIAIGERAIRAYIERRYPDLAKALAGCKKGNDVATTVILRRFRTKDPTILLLKRGHLNFAKIWEVGRPQLTSLRAAKARDKISPKVSATFSK